MLALYSLVLFLVLLIGAPWWLFRMATSGKYREGLAERLGRAPERMLAQMTGPRSGYTPSPWARFWQPAVSSTNWRRAFSDGA